jgi:hypothetical protein
MSKRESAFESSWLDPTGLKESLYLFFAKADRTPALANAIAGNASPLYEIVNRGGGDAQSLGNFIDFQHLRPRIRTTAQLQLLPCLVDIEE